ncbi:unnamed protein product [Didymodactylos carnosus]|uniref:Enoyl reductase (ER) domain-containing protein n=1 Tax=Didymodactylos carnosus TaxID=1234261 RepID=A0A813Z5U7_9BILA|nr:unnamed protein product [Didymodactylos carnosus]CAF1178344.1 unnamed protein product [Didymodactylos carnosus]CAF3677672.1 unnamed protein product [Didymodactylos carnosus]CAF3989667.1 unnamed protein product [Didymodactylos carnosus]
MTQTGIPDRMKAAQQRGFGAIDQVLTVAIDVPVPRELKSDQILVRVHAASINPIDWKILNGNLSLIQKYSWPHIPGFDCSGIVVDVGPSVKRFRIGDCVYGNVSTEGGSYAEYVRGSQKLFALKPKNLSHIEASACPLACETSYQALFNHGKVTKDSKVFICGGATATGLFGIQLAKAVGAHVATTCSERNLDILKNKLGLNIVQNPELGESLGDLLVINYQEKDFGIELNGQNYDVVYDCTGGYEQWSSAQHILKPGGKFITIVGDDKKSEINLKSILSVGSSLVNRKFWSVVNSSHPSYSLIFLRMSYEELDILRTNFFEKDLIKPIIDQTFDFDLHGLQGMYEKSKSGKARGKLVLKIVTDTDEQQETIIDK